MSTEPPDPGDPPIRIGDILNDDILRKELERRLLEGDLVDDDLLADEDEEVVYKGSHGGFTGRLGSGEPVFVKYSDRMAAGGVLDAETGLQWVRNEAAGYKVADLLGWTDLHLPCIRHATENEHGTPIEVAVRFYVSDMDGKLDLGGPIYRVPEDQLIRAAVYDWIVFQTDRAGRDGRGVNYYVWTDADGNDHLLLFDHQLCFRPWAPPYDRVRSIFWDLYAHKIQRVIGALAILLTEEARVSLAPYLTDEQIDGVQARARSLME